MPDHTQRHVQMLQAEWPHITKKLRAETARLGLPPADFMVGLLHRDDDFAVALGAVNLSELSVLVAKREDFAVALTEFAIGADKPYADHADAILSDPAPGRVHALVFAGNEATRTQVAFAG